MNKIVLIGRLTKDPELRYTSSNVPVANFDIAVNRRFSDANGERIADFFKIVVWRKPAENVKLYCTKGDLVGIEGELQNRDYEDEHKNKRRIVEIIADRVEFLSQKQTEKSKENKDIRDEDIPYADFGDSIEISDDDIAF